MRLTNKIKIYVLFVFKNIFVKWWYKVTFVASAKKKRIKSANADISNELTPLS